MSRNAFLTYQDRGASRRREDSGCRCYGHHCLYGMHELELLCWAYSGAADARKLAEKIKKKGGRELVGSTSNLVDQVWGSSKPSRPNEKVAVQPLEFAGKEFEKKIEELRRTLEKRKSAGLIICE